MRVLLLVLCLFLINSSCVGGESKVNISVYSDKKGEHLANYLDRFINDFDRDDSEDEFKLLKNKIKPLLRQKITKDEFQQLIQYLDELRCKGNQDCTNFRGRIYDLRKNHLEKMFGSSREQNTPIISEKNEKQNIKTRELPEDEMIKLLELNQYLVIKKDTTGYYRLIQEEELKNLGASSKQRGKFSLILFSILLMGCTIGLLRYYRKWKKSNVIVKDQKKQLEILKEKNGKQIDRIHELEQLNRDIDISYIELRTEKKQLKEQVNAAQLEIDRLNRVAALINNRPNPPRQKEKQLATSSLEEFFFPAPNNDGTFRDQDKRRTYDANSSVFRFQVDRHDPQKARFEIITHKDTVNRVLGYSNRILIVCELQNQFTTTAKRITTPTGGKGIAKKTDGIWKVIKPVKIRFE